MEKQNVHIPGASGIACARCGCSEESEVVPIKTKTHDEPSVRPLSDPTSREIAEALIRWLVTGKRR